MQTQLTFPFTTPGAIDFDDPTLRADFDAGLKELDRKLQPRIDALRESERLTAEDYAVTILPID